jgi:arylsulfatase A-like enzyme
MSKIMKPNIIFILLDGARWDRLSVSPDFMKLTKEGTLLNNVTTAIPYTIGSINVTFSGMYGKENGIDAYYKMFKLKNSVKILPEIFQANGYFTACDLLTDKIITSRGFNIHQAHDEYKDNLTIRHPNFIKQCLEKANEKPLFLFLYFSRTHTVTVSDVLKKYKWNDKNFYERKNQNLKRYDDVFNEAGRYMKIILNALKELQIYDNTIIIFFSDHGTGVGERFGERNYGSFTYEETIRTFYLFISKQIKKGQISENLRATIDIFPTILDLAKIDNNFERPGESFAEYLLGNSSDLKEKTHTFSETGALHGPYPSPNEPNVFCIKTPQFKLMYLRTLDEWRLFDLENDPNELNNIYDQDLSIRSKLQDRIMKWIDR